MSEVNRASHYERKPRTDDDKERRRALYAAHKPRKAGDRPRCPVCGFASYSPSGTHPQCSWLREESRVEL